MGGLCKVVLRAHADANEVEADDGHAVLDGGEQLDEAKRPSEHRLRLDEDDSTALLHMLC